MAFTISKASAEEFDKVTAFLQEYFLKNLTLVKIFGLEDEEPPTIPDVADFILKAEDENGKLIGVAYNSSKPTYLWEKDKSSKEKQLVEFLEFYVDGCKTDVPLEEICEVWLLGVHPDWREKGLATALVAASEAEARALGFKAISSTAVNEYTAKLSEAAGGSVNYRLNYMDYPKLSGRTVNLKPDPPHDAITYYVKYF